MPALSAIVDEIAGGDDVALFAAQARQRLIVAHFALRQRDDRLQIKIDAVGIDRLVDQRDDVVAAQTARSGGRARCLLQLSVSPPSVTARRLSRHRQNALLLQRGGMARHRVRDLPHQFAQFTDLGGERIDRAARAVHGLLEASLHGAEPARNLAYLAAKVGGAARKVGDLVAEVAAVA